MAIPKYFLSETAKPWQDSKARFILGLVIGVLYAIIFYFFLYCSREILRTFSITPYYDLWVLSADEVKFYNLFYAFLASILGQSVCFTVWFERPKKIYQRNYRRTISILVDHKVLTWFFLAWFSKLAVGYALLFTGSYTSSDFYVFSFYPKYNYLFILIIIVLFIQSWTGFQLKYKRNRFKWIAASAIIISLFSFALSKINVLDYNQLNKIVLSKNINDKYGLELPLSDHYQIMEKRDRYEHIYMVEPDENKTSEPIFIMHGEEFSFKSLRLQIQKKINSKPQLLRDLLIFQLNIASDINMEYVELLKDELAHLDISSLNFAVVPEDYELNIKYYRNYYFPTANPRNYDFSKINLDRYNVITINPIESGDFVINDITISAKDLRGYISDLILENPIYALKPLVYKHLTFKEYFFMIQNSTAAILDLRDLYSKEHYAKPFNSLNKSEWMEVTKKYPMRVMEMRKGEFPILDAYKKNAAPPPPKIIREH